jgi:hypothetical protein
MPADITTTGTAYVPYAGASGDVTLGAHGLAAASATVGGTLPASAVLAAQSTTKGFLPPVMTTTEKAAISSPATGLIVFDSTLAKLCVYTGSAWKTVTTL